MTEVTYSVGTLLNLFKARQENPVDVFTELTRDLIGKLPDSEMAEFLKDNPLELFFDFDENPDVKFRTFLE